MRDYKGKEVVIGGKRAAELCYMKLVGKKAKVTGIRSTKEWYVDVNRNEDMGIYNNWIVHEEDLLVISQENHETVSYMKPEVLPYD